MCEYKTVTELPEDVKVHRGCTWICLEEFSLGASSEQSHAFNCSLYHQIRILF